MLYIGGIMKKKIVIIGAGLAGLQCGKSLLQNGIKDFIILEKRKNIIRKISWKTFPDVVSNFNLQVGIVNELSEVHFRSCDLESNLILQDNIQNLRCTILDSKKIYQKYETELKEYISINQNVVSINKRSEKYIVNTETQELVSDIIVDASGIENIVDKLLTNRKSQKAYMPCYGKRFKNCNSNLVKGKFYFDFDNPFTLFGGWMYDLGGGVVELGVATYSDKRDMTELKLYDEYEKTFMMLIKNYPFCEVFKDSTHIETLTGDIPLTTRVKIFHDNIYYIGDSKGTVPFSGYGIQNSLESAQEAAFSIIKNHAYEYFITPPGIGMSIIKGLWCSGYDLRKIVNGISFLSEQETSRVFHGKIDYQFFEKATDILRRMDLDANRILDYQIVSDSTFTLPDKEKILNGSYYQNNQRQSPFFDFPLNDRVILLPHCLKDISLCKAEVGKYGLICKGCKQDCQINQINQLAKKLEYKDICIAPGGSVAQKFIKETKPKAILAIACDLELHQGVAKIFSSNLEEKPIIHIIPLLKDGCINSCVNIERVIIDMQLCNCLVN